MKLIYLFCVVIVVFDTGCGPKKQEGFSKLGSSMYRILEDYDTDTIGMLDFVSISISERTEDGKIVPGPYEIYTAESRPLLLFKEKSQFHGDLFDCLGKLGEGDSAVLKINSDSVFNSPGLKKPGDMRSKYLVYTLKINRVLRREVLQDTALAREIEKIQAAANLQAKASESAKIKSYLAHDDLYPQKTASGLLYFINKAGEGLRAKMGDSVIVQYTAKTLWGKLVETTDKEVAKHYGKFFEGYPYGPITMGIVKPRSGFEEALLLFLEGTKARLIIPSNLAYGGANYKMLLPYTPLICDIQILKVSHTKLIL